MHNINNDISWQVLDGVICHTKIRKMPESIDIQDPFLAFVGINKILHEQNNYNFKEVPSLTLEGQIVAIADEVAQRISDINDGIQSRYYNKIKEILKIPIGSGKDNDKIKIENNIKTVFIDDIVCESYKKIVNYPVDYSIPLKSNVYRKKLICFSNSYEEINKKLEQFVLFHIAQSEEVRKSDSRSRFIIRQIFKAFYNDVTLLPDEIIYNYFNKIKNYDLLSFDDDFSQEFKEKYDISLVEKICLSIKKDGWLKKEYQLKEKNVYNFDIIIIFLCLLKDNDKYNKENNVFDHILNDYISIIGFYIASMTDNEAYHVYNEIYGHNI